MSPPETSRGRAKLPQEHSNFAAGLHDLPELKVPDAINDDILRAMMLASEGVTVSSEPKIRDAECLLQSIIGNIEKLKDEEGEPEEGDDTWTLKAYSEIAAVYGILGMTQQEKEMSKNLLVNMEARRGPNDPETLFIVQRDALRYWDWGSLEDAVLLFERAQEGQSKTFGEDTIHVIKNTLCLAATAMTLSFKYAGEGKEDLRAEKYRQSTKASERVEAWEAKMLSGDLVRVPDVYLLIKATRQMILRKLQKRS
ncbi:uncharacterized protein N7473_011003 [Penicillium subrubescens]|uniref:Uncharacterized protein n=1 Tax=Penicillium subrubescens TaxID=1316194 RepID=A0A1Q5T205_9EURO|nr:uncharacterized protein N7473_011003 [Penicillium subrubescens]KAJ5884117.1 hypothetical protein N7473_011003 [Penicillium subrubescens]OKO94273.1 hypothetical protein PENSUB_11540 [Penicillium subrubescens]